MRLLKHFLRKRKIYRGKEKDRNKYAYICMQWKRESRRIWNADVKVYAEKRDILILYALHSLYFQTNWHHSQSDDQLKRQELSNSMAIDVIYSSKLWNVS